MITRMWHGWTGPDNADAYEDLIRSEIFPGITARAIPGLERIELYRRPLVDEVEFVTIMRFSSMRAVEAFAGPDRHTAVVPAKARALLKRYEPIAAHYDLRVAHGPE